MPLKRCVTTRAPASAAARRAVEVDGAVPERDDHAARREHGVRREPGIGFGRERHEAHEIAEAVEHASRPPEVDRADAGRRGARRARRRGTALRGARRARRRAARPAPPRARSSIAVVRVERRGADRRQHAGAAARDACRRSSRRSRRPDASAKSTSPAPFTWMSTKPGREERVTEVDGVCGRRAGAGRDDRGRSAIDEPRRAGRRAAFAVEDPRRRRGRWSPVAVPAQARCAASPSRAVYGARASGSTSAPGGSS